MKLETSNGMTLIKNEDLHKIKEIAQFIPTVRNSVFKAAFNIKKLDTMLQELEGQNGNSKTNNTKTPVG